MNISSMIFPLAPMAVLAPVSVPFQAILRTFRFIKKLTKKITPEGRGGSPKVFPPLILYSSEFSQNERRGRLAVVYPVPNHTHASVRKAREGSLQVKGAKLFN